MKNSLHIWVHEILDCQALEIFLPRYFAAFKPPVAIKPDRACLALDAMTSRLKPFLTHLDATSFDETMIWGVAVPTKSDHLMIMNDG